jgi:hypothetical protein
MSVASRPVSTGKTRTCPHCKATILESLSICPGCMHHLRFDSEAAKRQVAAAPALRVEGIIRHPPLEQPLEYFVIIAIRNDRGEEVTRQVVNVGALQAAEKRTFTLSVEVLPPQAPVPTKSTASTGTYKSPISQPTATVRPSTPPPTPTSATAPSTGQATGGSAAAGGPAGAAAGTPPGGARPPVSPASQTAPAQGAQPSRGIPPNPSSSPNAPGSYAARPPGAGTVRPPGPNTGRVPGPNTARAPTTPGNPASGNPMRSPAAGNPTASGNPTGSGNPAASGNPTGLANPANPGNPAGPGANPASPTDSPAKPTSGYVLKPPSPGGPKRH